MKITKNQLKRLVKEALQSKLHESSLQDDVPAKGELADYAKKFDNLVEKYIADARKLADEGEELIKTNLLNHPEVGVRNAWLSSRIGMLRTLVNYLGQWYERARRFEP